MTQKPLTTDHNADWTPCQGGEILSLSQALRGERRAVSTRRRVLQGTAIVATLAICVGLGVISAQMLQANRFAGIACYEVLEHQDNYFAGELDQELVTRIQAHLERCEECHEH